MSEADAALQAGRWEQASNLFSTRTAEAGDPVAYEGLSQAAWWLDDADGCLSARESAYRLHRQAGDDRGAARCATSLAWDSLLFGQGAAVAKGWLGRAHELLAALPESQEHGWLAVRCAELALAVDHDPAAALAAAESAAQIGHRTAATDLPVVGLALQGLALIEAARVAEGMPRLDAAVAAATCGDVSDLMWMGKVCCWLIIACRETQDAARAAEWCQRVERLCAQRGLAPLFDVCRIQHASVHVARGAWQRAENELTGALNRLVDSRRSSRLDAVVQLGELRRRQGRLPEADALFAQAEFHPAAITGRALIRLAGGDASAAWSAMSSLLGDLPPGHRLGRAAVLPAAVLIARAAGQDAAATTATVELRVIAHDVGTDPLLAASAVADAAALESSAAAGALRDAVRRYQRAGLRHDEAQTRLTLAGTLLDLGDPAGAGEQLTAATRILTELDAAALLTDARQLAAAIPGDARGPLTARETQILRLVCRGCNNHEIALELVISPHTVHRHLANILRKLGQPSRAAAAAYAVAGHLV